MVCLRNVCVNTLHKGDSIFTNINNNNNNMFIFKVDEMGMFYSTCGRDEKNNRAWREDLERGDHWDVLSIGECTSIMYVQDG
jgi:hypothetical protein